MRKARYRSLQPGVYHCISRIIDRQFLIDDCGKEKLVEIMRRMAAFTGVDVLTFVVMTNHIHLLLAENEPMELTDEQLLQRLRDYYGERHPTYLELEAELTAYTTGGHAAAANAFHARMQSRMNDISWFMGTLKQCFTIWYNKKNNRQGPLWMDRFKSVLVEPDSDAMRYMAAYIDLNPIRANMVENLEDYRWSSYGQAVAGDAQARAGLVRLFEKDSTLAEASGKNGPGDWEDIAGRYRMLLYEQGGEKTDRFGHLIRPGFSLEEIWGVFAENGKLPWYVLARCRVRYFTEGVVFGSKDFVERHEAAARQLFGLQREREAKRIREWIDSPMHVFRRYWAKQLER